MTREEQIRQAALAYSFDTDGGHSGDLNAGRDDFIDGAEWADRHPASSWHSVADGDLPEEANGDAIDSPFLVTVRDGYTFMAYYGRGEEDGEMNFFDDCGFALAVDYWMKIPKLPND